MKTILITLLLSSTQIIACPQAQIARKALASAIYLETVNGGGRPLTKEIYSLSSEFDTYGIIFSYSGIQSSWKVKVDSARCLVKAVVKL